MLIIQTHMYGPDEQLFRRAPVCVIDNPPVIPQICTTLGCNELAYCAVMEPRPQAWRYCRRCIVRAARYLPPDIQWAYFPWVVEGGP